MLGGLRNIGGQSWNRRYVFVGDKAICYGEKMGLKEKLLPFETIRTVYAMPREQVRNLKGPEQFSEFGWAMQVDSRETYFCCESESLRNEWVQYVQSLLSLMNIKAAPAEDDLRTEMTMTAMLSKQQEAERERTTQLGGGGDDEDGDGEINRKSMKELERLAGNQGDDDGDVNMNVDDDDESDDDGGDEEPGSPEIGQSLPESQDSKYQRFLLPKAEMVYAHINSYKIDEYKDLFMKDDSPKYIRFSRTATKVAKRDNAQERDVVVTNKYLYLFAKGRFTKAVVRPIEIDQIVGVIESTLEGNLLALLVPSFHDILIRITPQQSMVGGSEMEVKYQLIAHLYAAHKGLNTGRSFIFREVENVRAVIRRNEYDPYLPLESRREDKLAAGTNSHLYPVFRTNADSIVYWSAMTMRINAERVSRLRGLVVTDAAIYITSEGLDKVVRRTPFSEVSKLMYDADSHGLLIKCAEVDALFTIKDPSDFAAVQKVIPMVASEAGQTIRCVPSRQLFSHCQLVETKKLIEMFGTNNADAIKKGMRLTQKLFRNSWKVSVKGVTSISSQMANIGEKGVDFLKSAGKEVTGALVDNAITGELLGVLGSAGSVFLSQHRFLQEKLIEWEDEEAILMSAKEPFPDQFNLNGSAQATELRLGPVGFSSHCDKYNLTATLDAARTSGKVIAVSHMGIVLFDAPGSSGGLFNPLKGLLQFGSSALKVDEAIEWKHMKGIVQSDKEPNVIGLVTAADKHSDIMLRVPNGTLACKLIAIACLYFLKTSGALTKRYARSMLNLWQVPRAENLKNSLRKTMFDPMPTLALRHPNNDASSDQLMLAVVEDVADKVRRYGDNTILFSSLAWRFRSSSTKQGGSKMEELLKDDENKNNKNLFKSFNLVLTNCAFYQCTKGGYDVVRRTDIRDITCVKVSKEDPDTMLLQVPSEFDILFRVEGRGREFLARLQDAFVAWTLYGLYFAHEEPNCHQIADFCFPTTPCEHIAQSGNLEKAQLEERSTDAASNEYREWFRKDIESHVRRFERASEAAENGALLTVDGVAMSGVEYSSERHIHWSHVLKSLDNCIRAVKFAHGRAYRFGLRGDALAAMSAAGEVLQEWNTVVALADQLTKAINDEEIIEYDTLREEAGSFGALSFLLKEQERPYHELSKKKVVLVAIETMLKDESRPIEEMTSDLAKCFDDAVAARVKESTLAALRRSAETRLQRERLCLYIKQQYTSGSWSSMAPSTKALLIDAAERLQVDPSLLKQVGGSGSNRRGSTIDGEQHVRGEEIVTAALFGIDESIRTGVTKSVVDAIAAAERQGRLDPRIGERVAFAKAQLAVLTANDDRLRELQGIRTRLKRSPLSSMTKEELDDTRKALATLGTQLDGKAPILATHRAIIALHVQRIEDELFHMLEQGMQSKREAQAMAEYAAQVKQRAEDERRALLAMQKEEEERAANRRVELVAAWHSRAVKLAKSFEHAHKCADIPFTRQCLRNAAVFMEEIKESLKAFPESCQKAHKESIDRSMKILTASSQLGQSVLDRPTADMAVGGSSGEMDESINIPTELNDLIEQHDKAKLIAYIQGRQDSLNRATIAEVRNRWMASSKRYEWVKTLHKNIHTAFALNNAQLLLAQIDVAKSHGYNDDVVAGAVDVLDVMLKEQQDEAARNQQQQQQASAPTQAVPTPMPKPTIVPLSQVYSPAATGPSSTTKIDHPIVRLHTAVVELLKDPSNTAGLSDKAKLRVQDDTTNIRRVVNEWIAVMQHRAKPSGIFRKTERNMLDVLEFVGQMNRGGEFLAPYTNRVLSDFERVKKFNNPQGHSGSYFIVQFMLLKGDLDAVLAEIRRLQQKDISDVFLEDSLHRAPACVSDLRIIANMCNQIEWPFEIHERSSFAPPAGADSPPRGGGSSGGGGVIGSPTGSSVANAELSPQELRLQNAIKSTAALRRAVQSISHYFATTLKDLGTRPTTEAVKCIFDENAHKGVGLVVRDVLCPALSTVLLAGFRSSHFMKKRHLWDLVQALSVRLKESSKALGGVGIPDAVDMVLSITDISGRNKQALGRVTEEQLLDIRWRMFICHCLNQRMLQPFFDSLYDDTATEFLVKFYRTELCLLVPTDDECATETRRIIQSLSSLPYVLCIDAEIW